MGVMKYKDPATGEWTRMGVVGPQGPQGPRGEKGDPGEDGKSAYQSAQGGGYSGTEEQFNTDLAMIGDKQDKITGTAGQFVVIGDDGNVATKTIANAEEASF